MLNIVPFEKEHIFSIKTRFAFPQEGKIALARMKDHQLTQ